MKRHEVFQIDKGLFFAQQGAILISEGSLRRINRPSAKNVTADSATLTDSMLRLIQAPHPKAKAKLGAVRAPFHSLEMMALRTLFLCMGIEFTTAIGPSENDSSEVYRSKCLTGVFRAVLGLLLTFAARASAITSTPAQRCRRWAALPPLMANK